MRAGWGNWRSAMGGAAVAAGLLFALSGASGAGKAHEHGVARLDIGVETARIGFGLELPLDSLVGFERAPRSDAERAAVTAALARLRDAAALLRIDGAAGCDSGKVELVAPVLGLGTAPAGAPRDAAHADLEARYDFACRAGGRAGFVEVGLFEALPRLQRLEVQVVTPRGQMKVTLQRPNGRIPLAR